MALSYIITEEEWSEMETGEDLYRYVLFILKQTLHQPSHTWQGSNALEILGGLGNLISISEKNIVKLCNDGIVKLLEMAIKDKNSSEEEILGSLKCIWKISFSQPNLIAENASLLQGVNNISYFSMISMPV